MAETFPTDWQDQPCYVVAIPLPLVPYVGGLMKIMELRGMWASDADYERAYAATLQFEECLMATCLNDLIESNRQLYRLLDTTLNGNIYTVVSAEPLVIEPDIPDVPVWGFASPDSTIGRIDQLVQLIDNTVNGTAVPLYSYSPNVKELLQSIIDALASEDTDLSSILSELEIVAGLLA